MVEAAARLEELHICCPFSLARLPGWIATRSTSLRVLGLHLGPGAGSAHLDCVGAASDLQELRLWGMAMTREPAWGQLERLRLLEIAGASLDGLAVSGAVAACPNLTDLALLKCQCSGYVSFAPPLLQRCRLDFVGSGTRALALAAPHVESLELQGFKWISLEHEDGTGDRLKRLTIANNIGTVYPIGIGRLPVLEQLSLRGVQWSWGAVSHVLWCAAEVKHLVMNIASCGDSDTREPFPEVDLVEFFNSHPKLRKFEVQGAMFAALCRKNCLKNLDSRFLISSLEVIVITMRSPSNFKQTLITLESLVSYSPRLRRMVISCSKMMKEIRHFIPDDFLEEIRRFAQRNDGRVRIE